MYTSYFPKAFNPYELIHVYLICANQMLRNNAEPKVTTRSQKSYRGAKFPAAEPFISTAEPNGTPRNQISYRGTKNPTAEPLYIYRGTDIAERRIFVPLGFSNRWASVQVAIKLLVSGLMT